VVQVKMSRNNEMPKGQFSKHVDYWDSQKILGNFVAVWASDADRDRWFKVMRLNAVNWSCVDFSGRNLAGKDFSHCELYLADLSGANLAGADLSYANLTDADLSGANLTGANLERATLDGAFVKGALFTSELANVYEHRPRRSGEAREVKARLARLRREVADRQPGRPKPALPATVRSIIRRPRGTDFTHVDTELYRADLSGRDLTGLWLNRPDLRFANLSGADLTSSHLIGADLRGANLSGAILTKGSFEGCSFEGAKLVDVDAVGASFRGADLTNSDLRKARLSGAKFEYAQLKGVRQEGTKWEGANMMGADGLDMKLYRQALSDEYEARLSPAARRRMAMDRKARAEAGFDWGWAIRGIGSFLFRDVLIGVPVAIFRFLVMLILFGILGYFTWGAGAP
jgi:uncharacterized protein YjbI with pentapeptide repeats